MVPDYSQGVRKAAGSKLVQRFGRGGRQGCSNAQKDTPNGYLIPFREGKVELRVARLRTKRENYLSITVISETESKAPGTTTANTIQQRFDRN